MSETQEEKFQKFSQQKRPKNNGKKKNKSKKRNKKKQKKVKKKLDPVNFSKESKWSLLTYNVYAQVFIDGYWYNNEWIERKDIPSYLEWDYRKKNILNEIKSRKASVICLQEVEPKVYQESFVKELPTYVGVIQQKKQFANVIFYDKASFSCEWVSDRSRILIVELKDLLTNHRVFLANVHLEGNPYQTDIRFNQIRSMFKHIVKRKNQLNLKSDSFSILVCGDFNECQKAGIYHLLSTGKITKDYECMETEKKPYVKTEYKLPISPLKSVFMEQMKREPLWSYSSEKHKACVDFMFYLGKFLQCEIVEKPLSEVKPKMSLQTKEQSSDHLPLFSSFVINKQS